MITSCTGCQTRYRLDATKVPQREIRVRCPQCQAVYTLDGTQREDEIPTLAGLESFGERIPSPPETPLPTPPPPRTASPAAVTDTAAAPVTRPAAEAPPPERSAPEARPAATPVMDTPELGGVLDAMDRATTEPEAPVAPPGLAPTMEPAAPPPEAVAQAAPAASAPTAVAVEDPPTPTRRRSRDKARMLARALVSDILVYNREKRDQALAEGNLLEALGAEIKKSWELYKEKVGAEVANDTTHFRDALNEILAGGDKIF